MARVHGSVINRRETRRLVLFADLPLAHCRDVGVGMLQMEMRSKIFVLVFSEINHETTQR